MNYTRVFNELGKNDAAIAGGKGASLGEMTQAGIPVPPGFVVLAPTFDRFLTETDLVQEIDAILHGVKHDDVASVEHASEKIQGLILAAKMPADIETAILDEHAKLGAEFVAPQGHFQFSNVEYREENLVAVRSSATAEDGAEHAWAGQLDTHLNTPREEVVRNVQRCWSSLFTPRAIFYRFEKGLHGTSISVAVVVQKMVQSELSGIAFSVHPVTEDRNQLIIEAGYGLGEAIVSGQVTPDSYVVEKNPRRIIDVNVSEQSKALYRKEGGGNEWRDLGAKGAEQVLSEARILELAELIIHIENHYGFPCDIEWAYEAGKFYITQSRPITTLSMPADGDSREMPDSARSASVTLPVLSRKDFDLTFEADGLTVIGQDMIQRNYLPPGSVQVFDHGHLAQYNLSASIVAKGIEGEVFYRDTAKVKKITEEVWNHARAATVACTAVLQQSGIVSVSDMEAIYQHTDSLHERYSYSDTWYTDGAFRLLPDAAVQSSLSVIEGFKNDFREKFTELFFTRGSGFIAVIERIAQEHDVSLDDVYWYRKEEIYALIGENLRVHDDEIQDRKDCYVYIRFDDKCYSISGNAARAYLRSFLGTGKRAEVHSWHGTVAHGKGRVIHGKVAIINSDYAHPKETERRMAAMEKGSILVSLTTAPDLMPALRKAAAIVTDVGGLLSHAGIVARELDIPCVVGVQDASKILKDGDLVEVDAEKGVVRRLNNKNEDHANLARHIRSAEWQKDWEGKFSLLNCISCEPYYQDCFDILGTRTDEILIFHRDGITTCLLSVAANARFAHDLAEGIMLDKTVPETWAREAANEYATLLRFSNNETTDVVKEFPALVDCVRRYSVYMIGMKSVINVLKEPDQEHHVQTIVAARKQTERFYFVVEAILEKVAAYVAQRTGYETVLVESMLVSELLAYLSGSPLPPKDVLAARRKGCAFHFGSSMTAFDTAEAEVLKTALFSKNTSVIRGTCAYPGFISGRAVIITDYARESDKLKQGDILVTGMTDPNFLPVMTKAAAILVDTGGLLSHAAISARELRVPCVIGLECATAILKDGDLVEVDAEAGVVRVLEHADVSPKTLSKFFERERPLMYMMVWYDSDHDGLAHFTQQKVCDTLGIIPPKGTPGSVWYPPNELADLETEALRIINASHELRETMLEHTRAQWDKLAPYLKDGREVATIDEFERLYADTCLFWHAMCTVYFRLPDHAELDATFREGLAAIREETQEYSNHMAGYMQRSFERLAPTYARFSHHIAPKEVRRFVEGPSSELVAELERRVREGAFILNGVVHPLSELDAVLAKHGLALETIDTNASEFTGAVGYRGSARGRVRVVMSVADIASVQEGEILVSVLTDPNYVPAMQKAAAFVTDEGGVMSHAAIVAREMKKPCVIGTKVATQVLKDGDLVEVDAEKGVVRVVERASVSSSGNTIEWKHLVSRNAPPHTWSVDASVEQTGGMLGPISWKYNESLLIKDPDSPLTSEFSHAQACDIQLGTHLDKVNTRLSADIAKRIAATRRILAMRPGKTRADAARCAKAFRDEMQTMLMGFDITPEVRAYAHKVIGDERFAALEEDIGTPIRKTFFQREGEAIGKAHAAYRKRASSLDVSARSLARRFGFLHQEYWGRAWIADDYAQEIREYQAPVHAHAPSAKRVRLSAHERWLVKTVREMVYMYDEAKNAMIRAMWALRETLRATGIEERSIFYMTDAELSAWAAGGSALPEDVVRVRESGYAFHAKDGVVQEIYGAEDVRELIRTLGVTHYVTPAADNAVKGVVAYKGVARGKVVIVRTHEDAEHVERGDILIASMTTPELLGGMYRAAAFVTDEGGVTCHAAIIARELKKPCIVGTRTATRAFKTGDVVEVDAQKGEVRIIQRAQNDLAHELSPARWDYVGLYKSPVFAAWFWCAWPQTDLVARAELPSAFYGYLAVRGGHACWTQDMKRALLAFIREKLAHDPGYFARMTQVAQEVFDEGIAFAKGISPDAPLLETFRELVRHRTRMQFFWAIGATMSYYFVDMLLAESAAESGIPESEIVFHLPKMQTPMLDIEQHARELRSQLAEAGIAGDIPAVAAAIRSSKELHASFDAFIREYDWIQETNWIGAPAELEDVLSLVCKEPHEDTHAALHAETPRFTEVAAASGHIGFWRQAGCEYCSIFEMRVRPLLERIANEAGMSYRELLRCSPEEIMSTQNLADLKAIAARRADDTSATVTREKGSVLVIDSDTSITSLSDALIPSADTNQKELRGEVGYKGHARGTARIIIAREDFHRFQDGDVLVAPMTTPDYVILMQRASAIVTNMGGLLCHAAIVSRELKKPCVIGTKVATQVLKDGDLVEVDAEKGVVRVVERATV